LAANTLGSPLVAPLPTNSAFMPYNSPVGLHSSNNALEALQQMQSQLAQLNSGLQNAFPRAIQQQMMDTLPDPRMLAYSTQYRPQQNGSVATNAAPTTNGSDDEIWNYMQHSVPQVHQSDQELQQSQQYQQPQQTNLQQKNPQQYDGATQQQLMQQQLKQNQNDSPQQRYQHLQEETAGKNSPKESKFMRLLQTVTDTLPDGAEPQGPVHLPNLRNKYGQSHPQQQLHQQPMSAPIGSQLGK